MAYRNVLKSVVALFGRSSSRLRQGGGRTAHVRADLPTRAELIVESDYTKVWFMPGEGDTLFVSFSPLNDKQEEPVIWGSPLFTKLNAPAIGFSSLGGDWYPWRDTVSLIPRISHIVARFSHIVVYGSSMGAYAAIKFSSLLNAGTVIALSPQWSITEADIGSFDDRFKTYVSPDLHDGMAIRSGDASGSVYVFVDPAHEADVQHIERISNVIACHIVPVRCVGHNTADFLANSGMSQPFFDAVHKREFDLRTARAHPQGKARVYLLPLQP
jgi:hypothetical protein